jgi:phosphoribosylglycinamide formyltransferase-1
LSESPRQPIVILISGRGSNMRALVERSHAADAAYSVAAVLSDRADAAGLEIARQLGVEARALPRAPSSERAGNDRAGYDRMLAAAIAEYSPSLIVLAGFMRILSAEFVERFAGRILNIHPSLLPKYAGLHTHRRALEAREAEHGVTVHFVTEQLDGGPPVLQARVPILPGDTESTLSQRVLIQEHIIYPLAVNWFCQGRLRCEAGKAQLDGRPLVEPVQISDIAPEKTS